MTLTYRTASVDGLKCSIAKPATRTRRPCCCCTAFPPPRTCIRDLIPQLADRYHVVAPDLPGFGFTDAPNRASFKYSFDHLAEVIERFTEVARP